MSDLFLKIVNMSISAGYIVLAVLVLRLLLKKAPKWITVVLWGIVAVRLVCPFTLESALSLIPSAEIVSPDIMLDRTPTIDSGIPIINQIVNPVISGSFTPDPATSANPLQLWIPTFAIIWLVGIVAFFCYAAISYARVKHKVATAVLLRDNIYQSESVVSPFVLGVIKPKIYLPFNMNTKDMEHVISHETAHIRRGDHLWKPLGFFLLSLHWFNPLMWLGYVLLCRDIELACDEKVIATLDREARADYSQALLTCSVNRRLISACPLAFGEVGVKKRVRSVLNYKKPAFWIVLIAILACVALAVCFLTNPPIKDENNDPDVSDAIHTEYDGVYISLKSIDTNHGGYKVFNVKLHNDTYKNIMYGEVYAIEYKDGDKWVSAAIEDLNFLTVAYRLDKKDVAYRSYTTQRFDISRVGTYRLLIPFSVENNGAYTDYKTWIEFKVGTDYIGESYEVSVVYANAAYSYVMSPDLVSASIDDGTKLYDRLGTLLGEFEHITLSETNFIDNVGKFRSEDREMAEQIVQSTTTAYSVNLSSPENIDLYYVLIQKDGSRLFVYGHYVDCQRNDEIRWIYKAD
ncbi:MAG: hypothetical protein IKA82_01915 [Clostridia bacterium]|nr:hypothetical protein [Clostridia bacterium]